LDPAARVAHAVLSALSEVIQKGSNRNASPRSGGSFASALPALTWIARPSVSPAVSRLRRAPRWSATPAGFQTLSWVTSERGDHLRIGPHDAAGNDGAS